MDPPSPTYEGTKASKGVFPPLMSTLDVYVDSTSDYKAAQVINDVNFAHQKKTKKVKKKSTPKKSPTHLPGTKTTMTSNNNDDSFVFVSPKKSKMNVRQLAITPVDTEISRDNFSAHENSIQTVPAFQFPLSPALSAGTRPTNFNVLTTPRSAPRTGRSYKIADQSVMGTNSAHIEVVLPQSTSFNKAVESIAALKLHSYAMRRKQNITKKIKLLKEIRTFEKENEVEYKKVFKVKQNELLAAWKIRFYIEYIRYMTLQDIVHTVAMKNEELEEDNTKWQQRYHQEVMQQNELKDQTLVQQQHINQLERMITNQQEHYETQLHTFQEDLISKEELINQHQIQIERLAMENQSEIMQTQAQVKKNELLQHELELTKGTCQDFIKQTMLKDNIITEQQIHLNQLENELKLSQVQSEEDSLTLQRQLYHKETELDKLQNSVLEEKLSFIATLQEEVMQLTTENEQLIIANNDYTMERLTKMQETQQLLMEKDSLQKVLTDLAKQLQVTIVEKERQADTITSQQALLEQITMKCNAYEQECNNHEIMLAEQTETITHWRETYDNLLPLYEESKMQNEDWFEKYRLLELASIRNVEYTHMVEEELFFARRGLPVPMYSMNNNMMNSPSSSVNNHNNAAFGSRSSMMMTNTATSGSAAMMTTTFSTVNTNNSNNHRVEESATSLDNEVVPVPIINGFFPANETQCQTTTSQEEEEVLLMPTTTADNNQTEELESVSITNATITEPQAVTEVDIIPFTELEDTILAIAHQTMQQPILRAASREGSPIHNMLSLSTVLSKSRGGSAATGIRPKGEEEGISNLMDQTNDELQKILQASSAAPVANNVSNFANTINITHQASIRRGSQGWQSDEEAGGLEMSDSTIMRYINSTQSSRVPSPSLTPVTGLNTRKSLGMTSTSNEAAGPTNKLNREIMISTLTKRILRNNSSDPETESRLLDMITTLNEKLLLMENASHNLANVLHNINELEQQRATLQQTSKCLPAAGSGVSSHNNSTTGGKDSNQQVSKFSSSFVLHENNNTINQVVNDSSLEQPSPDMMVLLGGNLEEESFVIEKALASETINTNENDKTDGVNTSVVRTESKKQVDTPEKAAFIEEYINLEDLFDELIRGMDSLNMEAYKQQQQMNYLNDSKSQCKAKLMQLQREKAETGKKAKDEMLIHIHEMKFIKYQITIARYAHVKLNAKAMEIQEELHGIDMELQTSMDEFTNRFQDSLLLYLSDELVQKIERRRLQSGSSYVTGTGAGPSLLMNSSVDTANTLDFLENHSFLTAGESFSNDISMSIPNSPEPPAVRKQIAQPVVVQAVEQTIGPQSLTVMEKEETAPILNTQESVFSSMDPSILDSLSIVTTTTIATDAAITIGSPTLSSGTSKKLKKSKSHKHSRDKERRKDQEKNKEGEEVGDKVEEPSPNESTIEKEERSSSSRDKNRSREKDKHRESKKDREKDRESSSRKEKKSSSESKKIRSPSSSKSPERGERKHRSKSKKRSSQDEFEASVDEDHQSAISFGLSASLSIDESQLNSVELVTPSLSLVANEDEVVVTTVPVPIVSVVQQHAAAAVWPKEDYYPVIETRRSLFFTSELLPIPELLTPPKATEPVEIPIVQSKEVEDDGVDAATSMTLFPSDSLVDAVQANDPPTVIPISNEKIPTEEAIIQKEDMAIQTSLGEESFPVVVAPEIEKIAFSLSDPLLPKVSDSPSLPAPKTVVSPKVPTHNAAASSSIAIDTNTPVTDMAFSTAKTVVFNPLPMFLQYETPSKHNVVELATTPVTNKLAVEAVVPTPHSAVPSPVAASAANPVVTFVATPNSTASAFVPVSPPPRSHTTQKKPPKGLQSEAYQQRNLLRQRRTVYRQQQQGYRERITAKLSVLDQHSLELLNAQEEFNILLITGQEVKQDIYHWFDQFYDLCDYFPDQQDQMKSKVCKELLLAFGDTQAQLAVVYQNSIEQNALYEATVEELVALESEYAAVMNSPSSRTDETSSPNPSVYQVVDYRERYPIITIPVFVPEEANELGAKWAQMKEESWVQEMGSLLQDSMEYEQPYVKEEDTDLMPTMETLEHTVSQDILPDEEQEEDGYPLTGSLSAFGIGFGGGNAELFSSIDNNYNISREYSIDDRLTSFKHYRPETGIEPEINNEIAADSGSMRMSFQDMSTNPHFQEALQVATAMMEQMAHKEEVEDKPHNNNREAENVFHEHHVEEVQHEPAVHLEQEDDVVISTPTNDSTETELEIVGDNYKHEMMAEEEEEQEPFKSKFSHGSIKKGARKESASFVADLLTNMMLSHTPTATEETAVLEPEPLTKSDSLPVSVHEHQPDIDDVENECKEDEKLQEVEAEKFLPTLEQDLSTVLATEHHHNKDKDKNEPNDKVHKPNEPTDYSDDDNFAMTISTISALLSMDYNKKPNHLDKPEHHHNTTGALVADTTTAALDSNDGGDQLSFKVTSIDAEEHGPSSFITPMEDPEPIVLHSHIITPKDEEAEKPQEEEDATTITTLPPHIEEDNNQPHKEVEDGDEAAVPLLFQELVIPDPTEAIEATQHPAAAVEQEQEEVPSDPPTPDRSFVIITASRVGSAQSNRPGTATNSTNNGMAPMTPTSSRQLQLAPLTSNTHSTLMTLTPQTPTSHNNSNSNNIMNLPAVVPLHLRDDPNFNDNERKMSPFRNPSRNSPSSAIAPLTPSRSNTPNRSGSPTVSNLFASFLRPLTAGSTQSNPNANLTGTSTPKHAGLHASTNTIQPMMMDNPENAQLLQEYQQLKKELKVWKAEFVQQYQRTPTMADFQSLSADMKVKIARRNQLKKLLDK